MGRKMKKKVQGLLVCILLIATLVPVVESLKNTAINSPVPTPALTKMGANWTEVQKLIAPDGSHDDGFGSTVSLSGDTALIGTLSGSVYVFTRVGASWMQQAKLLPENDTVGSDFGSAICLDGDTALIGFPSSGSTYVFTRTSTTWTQQAKLLTSENTTSSDFGYSVSLSGDTALIGIPNANDYGDQSGSAYVFIRTGTTWTQQTKLLSPDGGPGDHFGFSVSVDGDTALIGEYNVIWGSAYVFTRTGTNWNIQGKLQDLEGVITNLFATSVSLDGDTALIGTKETGSLPSSVFVFIRTGTKWTQQAKFTITGSSIWVESVNGNTALIGGELVDYKGAAYLYIRVGSTWQRQAKLKASDGAMWDYFGCSVSLSGDTALIGAYGDNNSTGSAYIFTKEGENQPPVFGIPTPIGGSHSNPLNFTWNIPIEDSEGDTFSWTIQCSNGQVISGIDASNGTKSLVLSGLMYSTTYKVWVNATDPTGSNVYNRKLYTFTTTGSEPPNPPTINGPAEGKTWGATTYYFLAIDPDGDEVHYFIDWGDGTNSGWIGPYASGEQITKSHIWSTKGSYAIKAKAKDTYNHESDWTTLTVTMPCSYNIPLFQFWERLLERFPNALQVLRQLFGY
jgi:hypothetical protein